MQTTSAFASGVQGYQKAQQKMVQASQEIATPPSAKTPAQPALTESLLELEQAEQLGKASVKVIKTADAMLGQLLDTEA